MALFIMFFRIIGTADSAVRNKVCKKMNFHRITLSYGYAKTLLSALQTFPYTGINSHPTFC